MPYQAWLKLIGIRFTALDGAGALKLIVHCAVDCVVGSVGEGQEWVSAVLLRLRTWQASSREVYEQSNFVTCQMHVT